MTGVEPRREIEVLRGSSKVGIVLATLLMLALGALATGLTYTCSSTVRR